MKHLLAMDKFNEGIVRKSIDKFRHWNWKDQDIADEILRKLKMGFEATNINFESPEVLSFVFDGYNIKIEKEYPGFFTMPGDSYHLFIDDTKVIASDLSLKRIWKIIDSRRVEDEDDVVAHLRSDLQLPIK